jgi:hypothetical protein
MSELESCARPLAGLLKERTVYLAAWLTELRARLDRGELAQLKRLPLGNGVTLVNVELAVRQILEEIDTVATMTPVERERVFTRMRRRKLVDTLEWLQRGLSTTSEA